MAFAFLFAVVVVFVLVVALAFLFTVVVVFVLVVAFAFLFSVVVVLVLVVALAFLLTVVVVPVLVVAFAFLLSVVVVLVIILGVRQALGEGAQVHIVGQLQHRTLGAALKVVFHRSQIGPDDHHQVRLGRLADVAG